MKERLLYWKPTIITGFFLGVTLKYFPFVYPTIPKLSSFYSTQDDEVCNYDPENPNNELVSDNYNYIDYLYKVPPFIMESLFVFVLVSNWRFGRRPETNWHNPLSARIAEAASTYLPAGMAVAYKAGVFVADIFAGDRADGTNHMTSAIMSGVLQASRVSLIAAGLYDNAMDRSPPILINEVLVQTGQMRFIERVAMHMENGINYVVESAAEVIYLSIEAGIVRFAINDNNRLTVLATIYKCADFVEDILVCQLNDYAYYVERWVDIPFVSKILLFTGIASNKIVIGVQPRDTEVVLAEFNQALLNAGYQVIDAVQDLAEAIQDLAENAGEAFNKAVGGMVWTATVTLTTEDHHIDGDQHIENINPLQADNPNVLVDGGVVNAQHHTQVVEVVGCGKCFCGWI